MKLGVSLPVFTADPARPLAVAARAHELGVDGVFSPDHFFPPIFYPPSGPDRPALEAFSVLSAVAARHPGMHVGTMVARVTLRPPGILAKQAAALDAMSGGNAILALGTGDRASLPEHERYGIPFPPVADRLALLEQTVEALRDLFAGRSYPGGSHVPPLAGPLLPPGAPAVWVGGLSDPVVAIAGRVGRENRQRDAQLHDAGSRARSSSSNAIVAAPMPPASFTSEAATIGTSGLKAAPSTERE